MLLVLGIVCVLCAGCGGSSDTESMAVSHPQPDPIDPVTGACSVAGLEAQMNTVLSRAVSEVDFSYSVERGDGRRYTFNRGEFTPRTVIESASASKLVSTVVILRLVEQGRLALTDRPQDRITGWAIDPADSLYGISLAQLLSLTSGLQNEPPCLSVAASDFVACTTSIANANAGNDLTPGQQFFYNSAHHQVAGLMAINARGVAGWQDLFTEFQAQTGLFQTATYDVPSVSNPLLAGGMHFVGEEYMAFLRALKNGTLLNVESMGQIFADHTAAAQIIYSPIRDGIGGMPGLGEDWHYGLGLWHECISSTFNCEPGTRVSSPGALGAYPFWDRRRGYFGIVSRQGEFGTIPTGIAIERSVRYLADQWAGC